MNACLTGISMLILATVTGLSADTNGFNVIIPPDNAFAVKATELQKAGASFDTIFTELCKLVIVDLDANPKSRVGDQVRAMFGGMWSWMLNGGKPTVQNQNDKAMHFIGGGMFQGYFDMGWDA